MSDEDSYKNLKTLSAACVKARTEANELVKRQAKLNRQQKALNEKQKALDIEFQNLGKRSKERQIQWEEVRRQALLTRTKPAPPAFSKVCPHNSKRKVYNCKICKRDKDAEFQVHRITSQMVDEANLEDEKAARFADQALSVQQD
jgi:hypothetical protein